MGPDFLIDSSVVIDYLRGMPPARATLDTYVARSAISIVTWIEVLAGAKANEDTLIRSVLNGFTLLQLTPEVAVETAFLRRTTKLKLPDAVILASSHVHRLTLLTRNTRDFKAGPGIVIPYTL